MILLIDIGNTRIKFCSYEVASGSLVNLGSCLASVKNTEADVLSAIDFDSEQYTQCYIASVGDALVEAYIIKAIKQRFGLISNCLHALPNCCGVKNAYGQHKDLGIDRWLSVLAVSHPQQTVVIVDAGSAVTIDVVSRNTHLGGLITPGLTMMRRSLSENTQNLKLIEPDELQAGSLFARDTGSAVYVGTLYMLGAYINSVVGEVMPALGTELRLVGTGGDFVKLQPLLNAEFEVVENLTFLGMKKMIENF